MPQQRVPTLAQLAQAQSLGDIVRWLSSLLAALLPVFQFGTTRLQGYDIQRPVSTNDGQVYAWDNARLAWVLTSLSQPVPTGVTPGTYGDSTHVGQFTVDQYGTLTFAQDVAIAFPSSNVPDPTRYGQKLTTTDGATWETTEDWDQIEVPPTSPSTADDEFNETSLDAKWTMESGVSVGTVDFTASPPANTCILDLLSEPGWLKLQNDSDDVWRGIRQTVTTLFDSSTNPRIMVVLCVKSSQSTAYTAANGRIGVWLSSDTTPTIWVRMVIQPGNGCLEVRMERSAGGSDNVNLTPTSSQLAPHDNIYLAIQRTMSGANQFFTPWAKVGNAGWQRVGNALQADFTVNNLWLRQQNASLAAGVELVGGVGFERVITAAPWLPGGG